MNSQQLLGFQAEAPQPKLMKAIPCSARVSTSKGTVGPVGPHHARYPSGAAAAIVFMPIAGFVVRFVFVPRNGQVTWHNIRYCKRNYARAARFRAEESGLASGLRQPLQSAISGLGI